MINRRIKSSLILVFTFSILIIPAMHAQQKDWNMYRGDQMLSGFYNNTIQKPTKIEWQFNTVDPIKSAPVTTEKFTVIGSTGGTVICIDANGKHIWNFKTDNAIEAPALILNNQVFVGNLSGKLVCLNLKDGIQKWEFKAENQIMGAPNFVKNGNQTKILIGSYDFNLYGLNATDGKLLWKYELENYLNGTVAIQNQEALFGGCDGFLHNVNTVNGKLLSKTNVATYIASSPAVANKKAFTGDYDGRFTCIDLIKPEIVWQWNSEQNKLPFIASPAVHNDYVIIAGRDKMVYCFSQSDGRLLWKTNAGFRVDASPVIAQNGVLIVNMRGDILLLDVKSGKIKWTYELGVPIVHNPAFQNGNIILGGQDGIVYCLK